MHAQYQLFEQLELQRQCHIPTNSVTLVHELRQESPPQLCSIAHLNQYLKDLPFLQKELQSSQYFGCEEIEYDLLH